MLPPVDYGHLNTLVALFMIISVPASTAQTAVTKFVSSFQAQNQFDHVKGLLHHFLLLMFVIGASLFLLFSLGSSFVSSFLQISSYGLIFLLGASLFFAAVLPIPWGGLSGLQKFGSLTLAMIISSGLKLILGIFLVFFGLGVMGAMSSVALSYFIGTLFSLLLLERNLSEQSKAAGRAQYPRRPTSYNLSAVYRYLFPVGLTLLCFMVLTNIDLILVKHFFTPVEAGYYSIAQMVGKIILFLPLPIVMVMFPKLSTLEGRRKKALSTLGKGLAVAGLLCGGAVIFSILFPLFIVKILSGKAHLECSALVRIFSVNMTLFSLTLILLYYHLSTPRRWFLYPLVFFTLIEIGLMILFHDTLIQVLMIVGIVAFCLFIISAYLAYRPYESEGEG
jgi:O-antigen/teichoic acid export membrane protein